MPRTPQLQLPGFTLIEDPESPRSEVPRARSDFSPFSEIYRNVLQIHDSSIKFWQSLSREERRTMAAVTEDMPLSVRDLGGLMSPYKAMLRRTVSTKIWMTGVIVLRLMCNLYVVGAPAYNVLEHHVEFNHSHSHAELHNDTFTVCHQDFVLHHHDRIDEGNLTRMVHRHERCIDHQYGNIYVFDTLVLVEAAVIISASLVVLGYSFYFLFCLSSGKVGDENISGRARFLQQRPFVFVLLPRFAGGWSLMSCLMFVNVSFAFTFFTRGDFELYVHLMLTNLSPRMARTVSWIRDRRRDARLLEWICWRILDILMLTVLILVGAYAMRMKFLKLYFATTVPIKHWGYGSWLHFLGFINQVIGIFDFDFIEFNRVLLMKFGGDDSRWNVAEMKSIEDYFGLLFRRLAEGRLKGKQFSGLQVWASLITFTSDILQDLLLSNRRRQALEGTRGNRVEMLQVFFDAELAGAPLRPRLEKLERYRTEWAAECGFVPMKESKPGHISLADHLKQAERIRILAQIEAHLGQLQEYEEADVEFHMANGDSTSEEEEECSSMETETLSCPRV